MRRVSSVRPSSLLFTPAVTLDRPTPRALARAIALAVGLALSLGLLAATPASAGMTKLQYKLPPASLSEPADLTPIAPTDPEWNQPTFSGIGNPYGNRIERAGDPDGATTDYVEFARQYPQARDEIGPLRGDLLVDFETVKPGLPAIYVIHGGLVVGEVCSGMRRATQTFWAHEFTKLGYIVYMPDLVRPTNDRAKGLFGAILKPKGPGDCMADDGWEPGAKRAQISLQLGVRSFKQQLRRFAEAHPEYPQVASAFDQASRKVVAFGGSSGGHFAARLALRSEDVSGAPDDGPQFRTERRVASAVAIGSIGECTKSNPVRNFSKLYGLFAFPHPIIQPWKKCGPVAPDAKDSPIKFYMGAAYGPSLFNKNRKDPKAWVRWDSPLSGAPGWGRNVGWDTVVDGRWAERTCEDLRPTVSCTTKIYPVPHPIVHPLFPHESRSPGQSQDAPSHWESGVRDEIDAFFKTAKADDEV